MPIQHFTEVQDLAGKRVLVRADLNVPLNPQGDIVDDTRIRAALPAIRHALDAGAALMVTSHLGRPKEGEYRDEDSLMPVARRLSDLLGRAVPLYRNWTNDVPAVRPGDMVLLENCRFNVGEKQNDDELARRIAAICDVYVNDAFGTAHRAEATTHGVARHAPVACAGPLLAAEISALGNALHKPKGPVVAIVGGSKVSTKLSVLASLADKVDHLVVGGGIANTFLLAMGYRVGASLCEPAMVAEAKAIISKIRKKGGTVPLPLDVVCAKRCAPDAEAVEKSIGQLDNDDMILDVGRRSAEGLATLVESAGTVLWNGPVGVFEIAQFSNGTRIIGEAIARSAAYSVAGGGDTVAAVSQFGLADGIDYISTGGGAFLEFLEGKTLPAVAILEERGH